jgi:hypothetical protein
VATREQNEGVLSIGETCLMEDVVIGMTFLTIKADGRAILKSWTPMSRHYRLCSKYMMLKGDLLPFMKNILWIEVTNGSKRRCHS